MLEILINQLYFSILIYVILLCKQFFKLLINFLLHINENEQEPHHKAVNFKSFFIQRLNV